MFRTMWVVALGAVLSCLPPIANAGLVSQDGPALAQSGRASPGMDAIEAHQYRLPERRVTGQETIRQNVTAWEITSGSWDGVNLGGLSLVLVKNTPDTAECASSVSCYVSHRATTAQRNALVSAYAASQSVEASDVRKWRIEPAVISFEIAGRRLILHLGLVA